MGKKQPGSGPKLLVLIKKCVVCIFLSKHMNSHRILMIVVYIFLPELSRTMGTMKKDNGINRIIVENNRTVVNISERGGAPVEGWGVGVGVGVAMTSSKNLKLSVSVEIGETFKFGKENTKMITSTTLDKGEGTLLRPLLRTIRICPQFRISPHPKK